MSIPALLNGIAGYLSTKIADGYPALDQTSAEKKFVARWGANGAPLGMWKTSMGWFGGVYFGGARGSAKADGHYCLRYTVSVDITRLIALVGTGNAKTEKLLSENDLADKANRVSELLLSGGSIIANVCNTALTGTWQSGKGLFHENFEECSISTVSQPGPEWVHGVPGQEPAPNLNVITVSASGLAWRKNFENLYGVA